MAFVVSKYTKMPSAKYTPSADGEDGEVLLAPETTAKKPRQFKDNCKIFFAGAFVVSVVIVIVLRITGVI